MAFVRLILVCFLLPLPLLAGSWKSKGEITGESRLFTDDDNELTNDGNLGLFARVETGYREGPWRLKVRAFGRVDREDQDRDLTALEEAWVGYRNEGWEFNLGYQMLNWTATEAFHPADILNSRNLDSNIENPEKLGEPMLSVRRRIMQGGLTLYYLPHYTEPQLPGPSSRLSFALPGVALGDAVWVEGDEISTSNYGHQYGFRFNQTVGNADFSVHYLDHMDRQQPVVLVRDGELRPHYFQVRNLGGTYLHIIGSLIAKVEYAYKDFEGGHESVPLDHHQGAFGFEYGWANPSGSETTLLFEGQGLFGVDKQERAALSIFQRDVLAGMRHSWNDTMGRELLVTAIYDLERSKEWLFNASYKQRLSDTWSVETGLRWIEAPLEDVLPVGLEVLDEANQVFLEVSRFF